MTNEPDKRIAARIDAIAKGHKGDRDNLHEHVLAEAEAQAGDGPVTDAHLDAAFAALGTDEEIRASFFPPARRWVPYWAMAAYAVAAVIASFAILSTRPEAVCEASSAFDQCRSAVAGGEFDLLLFGLPPLGVWAFHYLGPRWLPALFGGVWSAIFGLPAVTGGGWTPVGMPIAVVITMATAIFLWRRGPD